MSPPEQNLWRRARSGPGWVAMMVLVLAAWGAVQLVGRRWSYGALCLAAALGYLMIHQQDPVGLVTCDSKIQTVIAPHSEQAGASALTSSTSPRWPGRMNVTLQCCATAF